MNFHHTEQMARPMRFHQQRAWLQTHRAWLAKRGYETVVILCLMGALGLMLLASNVFLAICGSIILAVAAAFASSFARAIKE